MLLRREEVRGESTNVAYTPRIKVRTGYKALPKELRQNLFLAAGIHNHPIPTPTSPNDLSYLFIEDSDPFGQTAAFVSSQIGKIVIFRGEETPTWNKEARKQKVELWNQMIKSRVFQFCSGLMSIDEKYEIQFKVQMAFLRDVTHKYDLQPFSCPLRKNIARRMIF